MKEQINKIVNSRLIVLFDSSIEYRMANSCQDSSFWLNLRGVFVLFQIMLTSVSDPDPHGSGSA